MTRDETLRLLMKLRDAALGASNAPATPAMFLLWADELMHAMKAIERDALATLRAAPSPRQILPLQPGPFNDNETAPREDAQTNTPLDESLPAAGPSYGASKTWE